MALAPSLDLFGVPSQAISSSSISAWRSALRPSNRRDISLLTCATALVTPLPPKVGPPSRKSTASCDPRDAPAGGVVPPPAPPATCTSTPTVGCPRESQTCRAWTFVMVVSVMNRFAFVRLRWFSHELALPRHAYCGKTVNRPQQQLASGPAHPFTLCVGRDVFH